MSISSICNRNVVTVSADADISTAARLLRETHVGMLVVTEKQAHRDVPVGVVTDRDLVVEILAQDVDPADLRVGDVMSREPKTVHQDNSVELTLREMGKAGVRRLVVVDADGTLTGVVSMDDVFRQISAYFMHVAEALDSEQFHEARTRP